ncbi:hypothetical protein HPB49_010280 [Dermacentor silvarum]|uniref:Uncharacterized protein n=1 Tax=Dermacentor silvarum TaxID=543639 RepID=A0ACB8DNX3_DERSI|nr:hypothetical protein HPB49_010280 [Dermacentor silvarum]
MGRGGRAHQIPAWLVDRIVLTLVMSETTAIAAHVTCNVLWSSRRGRLAVLDERHVHPLHIQMRYEEGLAPAFHLPPPMPEPVHPFVSRVVAHSSAYWPDPGPDGSSDFYEDQFRLRDAGSLRPASPYDADRQRALLEGTFHRAPVQQLSLTSPTNDPAPCSILESCSALSRLYKDFATITWTVIGRLLENFIDRSTLSTAKNDVSVNVSKIAINQLERLPSDNGNHQGNHRAWFHLRGHLHEQRPVRASRGLVQRGPLPLQAIRALEPQVQAPDLPHGRRPWLALQLLRAVRFRPAERRLHGPSDLRLCSRVCPLAGRQDLRQATDHRQKRIEQPCKANSECHNARAACLKDVCACATNRRT